MESAVGGLGYENEPLICAGWITAAADNSFKGCFSFTSNAWQTTPYTRTNKVSQLGSFAFNPDQTGMGRAIAISDRTIDVLNPVSALIPFGWSLSANLEMPASSVSGCSVAINASTYFIVHGEQQDGETVSNKTYFLNVETNTLTYGPEILVPRFSLQCSKMEESGAVVSSYVVISGGIGQNAELLNSTEVLDLNTGVWRMGPEMPVPIRDGVMLEHPALGVIVVGGRTGTSSDFVDLTDIYYLPSLGNSWFLLPQKLTNARSRHLTFYVQESNTSCA